MGSPYKRRVPRSHRRVMLVLLTGTPRLSGYPISRAAMVGAGKVYPILATLEKCGWADSDWEVCEDDRPRRRFYRLTEGGRERVMELLGLNTGSREVMG